MKDVNDSARPRKSEVAADCRTDKVSPLDKLKFLDAALADLGHSLAFTVLFTLVDRYNSKTGRCDPRRIRDGILY